MTREQVERNPSAPEEIRVIGRVRRRRRRRRRRRNDKMLIPGLASNSFVGNMLESSPPQIIIFFAKNYKSVVQERFRHNFAVDGAASLA